uniref:O-antigen polymerase n=1 Tax=Shewanella putrefaciens (strain 200) TaxID=399804 RepID=E6XG22_SHEP2
MSTLKINFTPALSLLLFFSLFFNTESNVIVFYLAFLINILYLFVCISSRLKLKIEPFVYFYFLFLCWAMLSVAWARNVDLAISMNIRLVILFFCIVFTINLQNNHSSLVKWGYYGLLAGVLVNVPLTFFDFFYISGRFSGTTINPNHISLFSGFVIFLSILNRRVLSSSILILAIVFCSYLILMTGSRKGLLLVMVSLSILLFNLDRKKTSFSYLGMLGLVGIGFLFFFVSQLEYLSTIHPTFIRFYELTQINVNDLSREGFGGDGSTRWRLIFIVEGFSIFLHNPIAGIGLDNFKTIFSEDLYSHNNYVELLSTLGIVGFCLNYIFYFSIFKQVLKSKTIFCVFIVFFFLLMDFAMVSYFERMYILPLILIYFSAKSYNEIENTTSY